MVEWFRRESIAILATASLVLIFWLDLSSQDVYVHNFIVIPIVLTAALGRPTLTALVGTFAVVLAVSAAFLGGGVSTSAMERALLIVVCVVASVWVASIVRTSRARLRRREAEMRELVDGSSDIVFRSTPDDVIEWVSPSVERELGYRPEEMVGQPVGSFLDPSDVDAVLSASRELSVRLPAAYRARFQRRDGSLTWLEVTVQPVLKGSDVVGRVGAARCIDRQVKLEEELRCRASTDDLTGFARRGEALQHLTRLRHLHERTGQASAVIFCDIDLFQGSNDTYGHAGRDARGREHHRGSRARRSRAL